MSELLLRTDPAQGIESPSRVDREARVIHGYSVATIGKTRARCEIDAKTLGQIVALGNAPQGGVKARFSHPDAATAKDGIGSYLGRSKNFRIDGDRVRADLHLSLTAAKSPMGNLLDYVLDLAEEAPDAFGASMAVNPIYEQRAKALPLLRMERLMAVDIVDDPAAGDGLFSSPQTDLPNGVQAMPEVTIVNPEAGTPITVTTAPPPAVFSAADVAAKEQAAAKKAADDAILAERKRGQDILALCATAGLPDQAKTMIEAGFSVDHARTELFDAMCRHNKVLAGDTTPAEPKSKDENATFAAEWDKDQATFSRAGIKGITKEAYIRSRRVSEGLEELVVGGAA